MRLSGSVALVTGGQQGIGRAIALRLAEEGADVALNFLDDAGAAAEAERGITALGRRCVALQADLGRRDDIRRMIDEAEAALGPVDLLVNNAGIFPRSPALDLPEAEWDAVLAVNLAGPFFAAQAVARRLVALGRPGAIVNISSRSAYAGSRGGAHYSASKAGLLGLTRVLALELAPYRIRVNAVAPGLTDTAQPRGGMNEEEIALRSREVPLGRMAQPNDVASVVAFLASDDARHVTGQVIHVNGGEYFGP